MNLYASLRQWRERFVTDQDLDPPDEREILKAIEAVSRGVDDYVDDYFFVNTEARSFDGNGRERIKIPWLLSQTAVKLDEDTDGVYETSLTLNTDFWLRRPGHRRQKVAPFTFIVLNPVQGSRSIFAVRPDLLEITGEWGHSDDTDDLGGGVTATTADATTTKMTTNKSGTPALGPGDTVLVGTERIYIAGGIGAADWLVVRGVNGTAAAAHTDVALTRYGYEPRAVESVLIQAGRLWKRRETSYSTIIANPSIGTIEVFKGLDVDVREMLRPLRRNVLGF